MGMLFYNPLTAYSEQLGIIKDVIENYGNKVEIIPQDKFKEIKIYDADPVAFKLDDIILSAGENYQCYSLSGKSIVVDVIFNLIKYLVIKFKDEYTDGQRTIIFFFPNKPIEDE